MFRRPSLRCFAALVIALPALSCSETPTDPGARRAPTSSFESMDNRELLIAVVTRLEAIEARVTRESALLQARVDSALVANPEFAAAAARAVTSTVRGSFEVDGSVCVSVEGGTRGRLETSLALYGGADGHAGVDAYGSGAKAKVSGLAVQEAKIIPEGRFKLTGEVCARLKGDVESAADRNSIKPLIQDLLASVNFPQVANASNSIQLRGQKLGAGVDLMASFPDLQLGAGTPAQVLAALPLPPTVAALVSNPMGVLQQAAQAGQFAIDRVCDQNLFTGELAQWGLEGCQLRSQMPTGSEIIGIMQGLNGLPVTIGAIQGELQSACTTVNAMLPASFTIPPHSVNLGGLIGTVQVFPGYSRNLFPGLQAAC